MTEREKWQYFLTHDMTPEETLAFCEANPTTEEEGEENTHRQRDRFVRRALELIAMLEGFRERQDARNPWDINRTFRDLTRMRKKIQCMEEILCSMLAGEERYG